MIRLENGLTALLISDESYPFAKLDEEEKDIIEKELTGKGDGEEGEPKVKMKRVGEDSVVRIIVPAP